MYLNSRGAIQEVACWTYACRKFFESRDRDSLRANVALARIRQLHDLERSLKTRCESDWRERSLSEHAALIAAERVLRGIAIGRKNWLFVGSEHRVHSTGLALPSGRAVFNWDAD